MLRHVPCRNKYDDDDDDIRVVCCGSDPSQTTVNQHPAHEHAALAGHCVVWLDSMASLNLEQCTAETGLHCGDSKIEVPILWQQSGQQVVLSQACAERP